MEEAFSSGLLEKFLLLVVDQDGQLVRAVIFANERVRFLLLVFHPKVAINLASRLKHSRAEFVKQIIVKSETFLRAGVLDICDKVDRRIVRLADVAFLHLSDNPLQTFLLESSISRIWKCQNLFDKIVKAVDLDRGPMRDSLNGRDDLFDWNLGNSVLQVNT